MRTAAASGLEGSAEGVIGGDEEEAVELLFDKETHQGDPVRSIGGVLLDSVRRAGLAGEIGGRRGIEDDDPVASLRQALNGQPHARIGDVEDRPHPAPIINPEGFVDAGGRGGGKRQEKKEGEDSPKHSATPEATGNSLPNRRGNAIAPSCVVLHSPLRSQNRRDA